MENQNSVCYVAKINEVKAIEGADNIENLRELERLMKAHYTGIETSYVIFDNETHASVASAMISRCMRYLYGRKKK